MTFPSSPQRKTASSRAELRQSRLAGSACGAGSVGTSAFLGLSALLPEKSIASHWMFHWPGFCHAARTSTAALLEQRAGGEKNRHDGGEDGDTVNPCELGVK